MRVSCARSELSCELRFLLFMILGSLLGAAAAGLQLRIRGELNLAFLADAVSEAPFLRRLCAAMLLPVLFFLCGTVSGTWAFDGMLCLKCFSLSFLVCICAGTGGGLCGELLRTLLRGVLLLPVLFCAAVRLLQVDDSRRGRAALRWTLILAGSALGLLVLDSALGPLT